MTKLLLIASTVFITMLGNAQTTQLADSTSTYRSNYSPAHFYGGPDALNTYLKKTLRYPQSAIDQSIQGRVRIRFLVNETGELSHLEVVRGTSLGCDSAAFQLVSRMPRWVPATYMERPVPSVQEMPLTFRIQ